MQIVQRREGLHNKDPYITAHGGLAAARTAHTRNAPPANLPLIYREA